MEVPACAGVLVETLSGGFSCDRYYECGVSALDLDVEAYRSAHNDRHGADCVAPRR